MTTYIGIDNGATGTIGIIRGDEGTEFHNTPTKKEQSYTKKRQDITRLEIFAFLDLLRLPGLTGRKFVVLERPLVNPTRFSASVSALRVYEAQVVALEMLGLPYMTIDSREWQKVLLPEGTKGEDLKKVSADIGTRLFPEHAEAIRKHKDADGLLIAEWARRKGL